MRIEYHRTLIADTVRNAAFEAALRAVIVPGKSVVADIGAGTGLLGLLAAKLGARDVFLFEAAEVAGVAEKVIKANGARNCHLIPCHSTEFDDALKVDVIVSETLGNYALEENVIATLADARRRFLKPGGKIVPSRIVQFAAPVISDRVDKELAAWRGVGNGIDLSVAETMSRNNAYVRLLAPGELHLPPVMWDEVDLTGETRSARKGRAQWSFPVSGKVYGVALWWQAELAEGVRLSTAPDAPRTHWEQLYLPLLSPIAIGRGDGFGVEVRSRSSEDAGTHIAWRTWRRTAEGQELDVQRLDLDKGFLP